MGILYPVLSAVVLFQKCSAWSPLNTQALETLDKFIHNLLTCPFSWWPTNSNRFFFFFYFYYVNPKGEIQWLSSKLVFTGLYGNTAHSHNSAIFCPPRSFNEWEWVMWTGVHFSLWQQARWPSDLENMFIHDHVRVIKDCFAFCCFQWQKQGQMPKDKKPSLMYPGCKGLRGLERCFYCDK